MPASQATVAVTSGAPAFSGASDLDILNQIATGAATPPAWPDGGEPYPAELSAIVMRALAPDPAERFPSMQAFQVALESFARGAGLDLSTVALAAFIQALFADELAAWHAAERAGKSLGEHLAARPQDPAAADPADRTATDAFGKTRPSPRAGGRGRRALATAGFVALSAVAGGLIAKKVFKAEAAHPEPSAPAAVATRPDPAPSPPVPRASAPATTRPVVTSEPPATPRPLSAATVAKSRGRGRLRAPATNAPPAPTAESRLRTWDPDSPVPP